MNNCEIIKSKGEVVAIVLKAPHKLKGVSFFTPHEFSQQLGIICHEKNYVIGRHVHREVLREIRKTQEVLYVLSGRIKITLYKRSRQELRAVGLKAGDAILLASGGHDIKFLQDSKLLEVKQGPYSGVAGDKEHF